MPENKPSTFRNEQAEYSVICSVMKYPPCIAAFEKLSVDDFKQSYFAQIFAKMRELAAAGIEINRATVNWDLPEAEMLDHAFDWDNSLTALVEVIKDCSLRDSIVRTLGLDFEKAEAMSTPTLVLKASEKHKEIENVGKQYKALVDAYLPSLAQKAVRWDELQTEDEIVKQQGTALDYIVEEIIPRHRVTMLFGQEKSGKSLIAWDLVKHIVNGAIWLNRKAIKTPCLYIDLEDGILGSYIGWLKEVGKEKVRFVTLRSENGIPALDDKGLLAMCAEKQPVIVLDSLHKLFTREKERKGASAWNAGDYEPVLEKIRQLCVAGATVILIHHSTKADNEQYRDSSAIGANVDFLFAVVGDEPVSGVKKIHLIGKPSRGAQPPTVHILAFPHIIELGHLCVDAGLEKEDAAAYNAANEVRQHGPSENRNDLCKRIGGTRSTALEAIKQAIACGYLIQGTSGEINLGSMPLAAPVPSTVPSQQKTDRTEARTDETEGRY